MSDKNSLKDLLNFAEKLAINTGKILLNEQSKLKILKYKDIQDILTSADIASENYVIDSIQKEYPSHGILSEEKGELNSGAKYRWVIDPLDGTKEFARGLPLFNFSLALEYKQKLVLGVVYRPTDGSLYSAAKGVGSFLNGNKIRTSSVKSLDKAFVYCYIPSYFRNRENYDFAWEKLKKIGKKVYRLRTLADENTALCWVASGGCEAYVNLGNPPKWHDIAPGIFISTEAGAKATDIKGNKLIEGNIQNLVVANNRYILNELLETIND